MVDVEMSAGNAPEVVGETSKQGLRRMKRLALEGCNAPSSSNVMIHPTTGNLIHPAPAPHTGHIVSSLYPGAKGRLLPVQAASRLSHSHDGRYLVLFHPTGDGGTLAIYPQSIISPYASPKTSSPTSTLLLPRAPLDIIHLFPPRMFTESGLAAQAGPVPPAGYHGSHGPALLVLMPDGLLLIHPQRSLTGEGWSMNVLKAPLDTRAQTKSGDPVPVTTGLAATKGWLGLVTGNDGVWAGIEVAGHVKVVRVELGMESGRWFVRTIPMPRLILPATNLEQKYQHQSRSVQKILFSTLPATEPSMDGQDANNELEEGVSVSIIARETSGSDAARTHIATVAFERKLVTLADGFAEISSLSDLAPSWDWELVSTRMASSVSPEGTFVVDMLSIPSSTGLAIAVLESARGNELCRLDLHKAQNVDSETWEAIHGESVPLTGLQVITGLVASSGLLRGSCGLACVLTANRAVLVPWPSKNEDDFKAVASTITLSVKQNVDWSDAIRAARAYTKKSQREEQTKGILKEAFALMKADPELDPLLEASRLQVALFGNYDQTKRDLASEILQLQEAGQLFSSMATKKDGKISFELESIWPLIFIAERVFSILANAFREIVTERATLEWEEEGQQDAALRVLYAINPQMRTIVCRLLAQIQAFIGFVGSVNRPILPPETRPLTNSLPLRDIRATALAKDRVKGMAMKEGVDVIKWGNALFELQKESNKTDADTESFLFLHVPQSRTELGKILERLPNPSSLFIMDDQETDVFDRVTFMPLAQKMGATCDRCAGCTIVNVPGAFLTLGQGVWERWKEERGRSCGCGGSWTR